MDYIILLIIFLIVCVLIKLLYTFFSLQKREKGRMRVHKLNNVNRALQILEQNNVRVLYNILFLSFLIYLYQVSVIIKVTVIDLVLFLNHFLCFDIQTSVC